MKKEYLIIFIIFLFLLLGTGFYFYMKTKDKKMETNSNQTLILFDQNTISINGNGATKNNNVVTIQSGGIYTLTGTSNDSNIVINADKNNVTLVFDSLTLASKTTAPIYVKKAGLVTITIKENTENNLSDNTIYQDTDKDEINAVIHSKADIIMNGTGILNINANYNNGITGKDSIAITDSTLSIISNNNGIKAKDSLKVKKANIEIQAGGNGIKAYNETDDNSGVIELLESTITITSKQDGIEAITSLLIDDGTYKITSGGGSSNASTKSDWGFWGPNQNANNDTETTSAKGLKADQSIMVKKGDIIIDSSDDSIHSNHSITILNGNLEISSGDDGIHADRSLSIEDGNMIIKKSYEGLEATNIHLKGGNVHINATDDGINAAGGADGSSLNRKGANSFASDNSNITISGGYYVIHANGDGLDSNGDIEMNDGTVIIEGPTDDGNGALDYNGTYNINGGLLIATGSSGMAEAPSTSSKQNSIKVSFPKQNANSVIQITDSNGKALLTFSPTKTYSSIVYSSSDLKQKENYEIWLGGTTTSENKDGIVEQTNYQGGEKLTTLTLTGSVTTYGNRSMTGGRMDFPPRR